MVALSERKIEIVRQIVEAAPDRVVGGLQTALAETTADSVLASVRRLVEREAQDRRLRNNVLEPIVPMCVGEGRDPERLVFPAAALTFLWRGLKTLAPDAVAGAALAVVDYQPSESSPDPFDHLVRIGADALRAAQSPDFERAAQVCDAARPGGAQVFAACLDIAPIVRRALPRLSEWTAQLSDGTNASARLAYKDAVAIADDAGPRFFEMLSAHLAFPWMVLRVISAVMGKPNERFLGDSELGDFGARLMGEIDDALKTLARFSPDAGPQAARAAGKRVELITFQISEVETCIDLSREHGWGHELVNHKKSLAGVVEGHLRATEKFVTQALPTQPARIARMRKNLPRLNSMPDPLAVKRALTFLTFVQEIRSSANYGGFAAARAKTLEALGEMLDSYVEEVLDLVRMGDVEDEGVAYAYLDHAADFSLLARDDKAAELVRRRAAALRNQSMPAESEADAT